MSVALTTQLTESAATEAEESYKQLKSQHAQNKELWNTEYQLLLEARKNKLKIQQERRAKEQELKEAQRTRGTEFFKTPQGRDFISSFSTWDTNTREQLAALEKKEVESEEKCRRIKLVLSSLQSRIQPLEQKLQSVRSQAAGTPGSSTSTNTLPQTEPPAQSAASGTPSVSVGGVTPDRNPSPSLLPSPVRILDRDNDNLPFSREEMKSLVEKAPSEVMFARESIRDLVELTNTWVATPVFLKDMARMRGNHEGGSSNNQEGGLVLDHEGKGSTSVVVDGSRGTNINSMSIFALLRWSCELYNRTEILCKDLSLDYDSFTQLGVDRQRFLRRSKDGQSMLTRMNNADGKEKDEILTKKITQADAEPPLLGSNPIYRGDPRVKHVRAYGKEGCRVGARVHEKLMNRGKHPVVSLCHGLQSVDEGGLSAGVGHLSESAMAIGFGVSVLRDRNGVHRPFAQSYTVKSHGPFVLRKGRLLSSKKIQKEREAELFGLEESLVELLSEVGHMRQSSVAADQLPRDGIQSLQSVEYVAPSSGTVGKRPMSTRSHSISPDDEPLSKRCRETEVTPRFSIGGYSPTGIGLEGVAQEPRRSSRTRKPPRR